MDQLTSNLPFLVFLVIGTVAWILLILSTIVTIWYAYVWTQEAIQSSVSSINTDMSI